MPAVQESISIQQHLRFGLTAPLSLFLSARLLIYSFDYLNFPYSSLSPLSCIKGILKIFANCIQFSYADRKSSKSFTMKVTNILIVSLVILGIGSQQGVIAKTFKKCDLARELARMGYSMSSLPDWICLIASESSFNTAAVGGPNTDGSFDWGLYQINDRYWCTKGRRGGECNINCKG